MTSEGITKGIDSSWIYFCWITHQQSNKSSRCLHKGFLGLWSGSGNSTLNCNFYLGRYKHQNYWFVNLCISPKIGFDEVDIPSATLQSTCGKGASPNSLHSTSVAQPSSGHLSELLRIPSRLEELLLVKLSISLHVFYRNFTSDFVWGDLCKVFGMGTFGNSSALRRDVKNVNWGCFAAMASSLLRDAPAPGSMVFGGIPVPRRVGVRVRTRVCWLLYLLFIVH